MVPDVSDETAAAITKAKAWPAFFAFFRLLWKRQREHQKAGRIEGEAACQAGVLHGEGFKGLARSISDASDDKKFKASCNAIARQMNAMAKLGLFAIARPAATLVRNEKGQIIRRPVHKGLVPAATITWNGGDEHRRPANRQGSNKPLKAAKPAGPQGSIRTLKGRGLKVPSDTTPISPKNISPTAGGHADGIGRPAVENGRLAKSASQLADSGARRERPQFPEDHREPVVWTGRDAERAAATQRRLEAEKAAREAEDAAWRAARERQAADAPAAPPPPPPNATEAAAALGDAVAALPPASRAKAKRIGRKLSKAERQAEADAAMLRRVIEEKRQSEGAGTAKAAATVAWKTKKARPKAAAAQGAGV
jgi:hypothetical protein